MRIKNLNMIYSRKYGFLLLAGCLLVLTGCDRDRRNPGWDYFPDMFYSNAYETYSPNEILPGGTSMLVPVEGTIPREMIPFQYGASLEERTRAGRELTNPLEADQAAITSGKQLYGIYCASCHGEKGDGSGYLVTGGMYPYPVRTLVSAEMAVRPDGEIYHTVTRGFGVMGAHGAQVRPEERWQIVLFIKAELQNK